MHVEYRTVLAAIALLSSNAASTLAHGQQNPTLTEQSPPLVLYTDLTAGPNSGGERDQGTYLSVFGKGFGASGLGSDVRVFIGEAEVATYLYLGPSKGRPDIAQITVQVGRMGNPVPGVPLPVKVVVRGRSSNTDVTFMVNPGRLLYVDNVKGNDFTAKPGSITRPFRHVQMNDLNAAAWGEAVPGDIIVMRGTGAAWTDLGSENYFIRYADKSGSAPTGRRGTGAIVLMGYPGEDVYVRGTLEGKMFGGCISAINGLNHPGKGQWAVISNLRLDCEGTDGPISQEIEGNHWRVINNDLSASTAPTSGLYAPRMAGITGNGTDSVWLGNHIHDVQGRGGEAHGIYIDGQGSYEIAYNLIERIRSGNGFQTYANGGNGSTEIDNVSLHHNLIREIAKHGINIADGSRANFLIYDNVVYDTDYAGLRFNTVNLDAARIFDNTFYNTNIRGNLLYGVLTNDWTLQPHALSVVNNILWPHARSAYLGGTVGLEDLPGVFEHNLTFGGSGELPGDSHVVRKDPGFVDAARGDFHLRPGSSAIGSGSPTISSVVTTDFDLRPRPTLSNDIGAYEH